VKVLTHRLLADNFLFIFRDANGKLMAYHPFTPDTQLVKVDDVTWEWRAEKDYADDDEGFAEQFRLSLQSSERASRFQHYVTLANRQCTPAPGTSALPPPPGVAVEDEFVAAAQKTFGSYSVARRQTFVDAVLLAALAALRTWCESDVTSESVACCPAAQRLLDNGGVMEVALEVALVAIATSYDPVSRAVSNGCAGSGVRDTLPRSSRVGCYHDRHPEACSPQRHPRSLGRSLVHRGRSTRAGLLGSRLRN
jgi:hypothetical protein